MQILLAERGLSPKKSLGQNFLVDHHLLGKLLDASGIGAGDVVLEVGPGAGVLTRELLERGARVVACELDAGLADLLRETVGAEFPETFTLIEGDALPKGELNWEVRAALGDDSWVMVANLPYGCASPLIVDVLVRRTVCRGMFVTIQKEVAERLTAKVNTREYGSLGVVAQAMAEVEVISLAGPKCFWPAPKVTSAMVSMRRREVPVTDRPLVFESFVRGVFMKRRKQLGGILGREAVEGAGMDPTRRPESLTVGELAALMGVIEPA